MAHFLPFKSSHALVLLALLCFGACTSTTSGRKISDDGGTGGGGPGNEMGGDGDGDGDGGTSQGDGDGDTTTPGDGDGTGGNFGTGGDSGTGGVTGTGGESATGGDSGTGGVGPDACLIGQTAGSDVVVIGDSFITAGTLAGRLQTLARAQGSLGPTDTYASFAAAGQSLAGNELNSIPNQYSQAVEAGVRKYVIMNGGGGDCQQSSDHAAALAAAEQLFATMASSGTDKVVYLFNPDPIGTSWANLKTCLDNFRPDLKSICDELTSIECVFVDLRDTWAGHPNYTSDGIHPSTDGADATAGVVWQIMQDNCVAQ